MGDTQITEELLRKIIREELKELISCNKCKKLNNKVEQPNQVREWFIEYVKALDISIMITITDLFILFNEYKKKHYPNLFINKCASGFGRQLKALNMDCIQYRRTSKQRLIFINKEIYKKSLTAK